MVTSLGTVKESRIEFGILCIEPESSSNDKINEEALFEWCKSNSARLRSIIYEKGGLLFRGWNLETVTSAEKIIFEFLKFETMDLYPEWFINFNKRADKLGVPAAGLVQKKLSRNVPNVAKKTMQCPHVEFGAGPKRPRLIGFFCEIVPKSGGGTGRVYFPDALAELSPNLRQKLECNGWWNPLAKNLVQPSILVHPETGLKTLQLYTYTHTLAPLVLEAYQQVRKDRPEIPEVSTVFYQGKDTYGLTLVTEDGKKISLSNDEMVQIYKAMFKTLEIFEWKKNDFLLFDNILYGHFRMPGEEPRKLHAIFAEEIDSRKLMPDDAPRVVQKAAEKKCSGAVRMTLNQLGPGGKKYVIKSLDYVPDKLFTMMGKRLWASGKGYNT